MAEQIKAEALAPWLEFLPNMPFDRDGAAFDGFLAIVSEDLPQARKTGFTMTATGWCSTCTKNNMEAHRRLKPEAGKRCMSDTPAIIR